MKTLLTSILLCLMVCHSYASDDKIDLRFGLRLGGGWAMQKGNFYRELSKVASEEGTFTYKGYTIPLGVELLLGIKNFRVGYSFKYSMCNFSNNTETYNYSIVIQPTETKVRKPTNTSNHLLANSLLLEYAFPINQRFSIAPSANAGVLIGLNIPGTTRYYYPNERHYHVGLSTGFSLNFELKSLKDKVTYVIAPTYNYYFGNDAQARKVEGHAISLEAAFRFRLIKKKGQPSVPRF